MTVWDTKRRRAFIRGCVTEKLAADGQSPRGVVIDQITAQLLDADHDWGQVLRAEVIAVYDLVMRSRDRDGLRTSDVSYDEEGSRVDRTAEQMTIVGLEDAALRKIEHGNASVSEGRADLAVAAEARRRCAAAGADAEFALVGQWLTREEIVAIRNGDEAAA